MDIPRTKSPAKIISVAERRKQVAKIFSENPNKTMKEIAQLLGVHCSVISRDVKMITDELNAEAGEFHTFRLVAIVKELKKVRKTCWEGYKACAKGSGSRWMEEILRAVDIENKMFGFYAPKRYEIRDTTEVTKEQRDATVAAVIKGDKLQKQIELNIKNAEEDIIDAEIIEAPL